jgi:predicted RNA-binding Zn-ribbon protein involved in translation (DUF1610 family)
MKIKVIKNTMATGRPLRAGTIATVSTQDAKTLIRIGKALPAGGDDPAAVDNREKDLSVTTRSAQERPAPAADVVINDSAGFVCPECGKKYVQRYHYENHLKTVHGI